MRIHRCRGAKLPYMLYDGGHINTPEIVCAALILEMVRFRCPSTPSRLTTLSIYDREAEDPNLAYRKWDLSWYFFLYHHPPYFEQKYCPCDRETLSCQ